MVNVRRWYVYLVCAITLNAVIWAVIALIQHLVSSISDLPLMELALQVSIIVVGLPIYLVHWYWAGRSAKREPDEHESFPRRLYLFAMLTAFLIPIINSAYLLLRNILINIAGLRLHAPKLSDQLLFNLVPLIILSIFWIYHWRIKKGDDQLIQESEPNAVIRQLYTYLFSCIGLVMTILAFESLLRWILHLLLESGQRLGDTYLVIEISRLVVGVILWLIFWRRAQGQFYGPDERERESVVRKVYLYLIVFTSVIIVTSTVAFILNDLFEGWLNISSAGDGGDTALALAIIISVGVAWAYHSYVLRRDAAFAKEVEQQALVRRIYYYLMAAVGLTAVLIGLGGLLSVLIRGLESKVELAMFSSILIAGFPVWVIPWRKAQITAAPLDASGFAERRSFVRRFYIYFFLFIASMTILVAAIYVVSQMVGVILGARTTTRIVIDIGQTLAFMIVAIIVWVYHGIILRKDNQVLKQEEVKQQREIHVTLVDTGDPELDQNMKDQIQEKLPGVIVQPVNLNPSNQVTGEVNDEGKEGDIREIIASTDVIVGPWTMIAPEGFIGSTDSSISDAILSSPATKLLIPVHIEGWDWIGVEHWKPNSIVKDTVSAIQQAAAGEKPRTTRQLSPFVMGVVAIITLCVLVQIIPALFLLLTEGLIE
jgi:hypothetical protein